jgi:hypothetical protein
MIRYATADGRVRRHRGGLLAALAPGAVVRAVSCQMEGREVLVSLRAAGGAGRRAEPPGVTLSDRFALPFGLQAWGVTALSGARVWLRLTCRARPRALALRGTLRLILETPGGPLRLRLPFLRVVAAPEVPDGLRWRSSWRVDGLFTRVDPGGQISGELALSVRCEGRPGAPATALDVADRPPPPALKLIREVTGQVTGLSAEPAGPDCAVVRGAVDLDIYGVDGVGASRWAGRTVPFAELLAVADGDRFEPEARIERLQHGPGGIQVALALRVTALRTEIVNLGGAAYRVERVAGTADRTVLLTERPDGPAPDGPGPGAPRARPASPWLDLTPQPAPPQAPRDTQAHIPLPAPAHAVTALQITDTGRIEALIKTSDGLRLISGQITGGVKTPVAATAYPVLHNDAWQLNLIITQEENGGETS